MKSDDWKNEDIDSADLGGVDINAGSEPDTGSSYKEPKRGHWKLIAGIVVLVCIVLGVFGWGYQRMNDNNTEQMNTATQKSTAVYKQSISPIVKAQTEKQNINTDWKTATVKYTNDNDKGAYQKSMLDLNTRRTNDLNTLTSNSSILAKDVLNALNGMHDKMNVAYNAQNPTDAANAYNDWSEEDKNYNKTYLSDFTSQLKKHGIQYKVDKDSDGNTTKIYY